MHKKCAREGWDCEKQEEREEASPGQVATTPRLRELRRQLLHAKRWADTLRTLQANREASGASSSKSATEVEDENGRSTVNPRTSPAYA